MAIRLVLLAHHYRGEWEWTAQDLTQAQERLERWRRGLSTDGGPDATGTIAAIRDAIADDLDTPTALHAVDAWAEQSLAGPGEVRSAPGELARAIDALLGVRL